MWSSLKNFCEWRKNFFWKVSIVGMCIAHHRPFFNFMNRNLIQFHFLLSSSIMFQQRPAFHLISNFSFERHRFIPKAYIQRPVKRKAWTCVPIFSCPGSSIVPWSPSQTLSFILDQQLGYTHFFSGHFVKCNIVTADMFRIWANVIYSYEHFGWKWEWKRSILDNIFAGHIAISVFTIQTRLECFWSFILTKVYSQNCFSGNFWSISRYFPSILDAWRGLKNVY